MATPMHRLQISLRKSHMQYLARRARREGASIAELIRRLVQREAEATPPRSMESLWEIVGMAEERRPLIDGVPVSEQPDLYLADAVGHGLSRRRRRGSPRMR